MLPVTHRIPSALLLPVALGLGLALSPACAGDPAPGEEAPCAAAPHAVPGPFVAGVTTLEVEGVPVEVWYPADRDEVGDVPPDAYELRDWLPPEDAALIPDDESPVFVTDAFRGVAASVEGPFPVVLFSHGLGGYRLSSTFLTTHLASWGFVVVAPDHLGRGLATVLGDGELRDDSVAELRAALHRVLDEGAGETGPLAGLVDASSVAAVGHSMGGNAALTVAADEGVRAWVTLASGEFTLASAPDRPALVMVGGNDAIAIAEDVRDGYDEMPVSDKRFLSVARAGHLAFTDICAIGRDRGGILAIARDNGVEIDDLVVTLATDGCGPEDLPPEEGWPVIQHYVTAHLRAALELDTGPAGLGDDSVACFDDRVAQYAHR